MRFNILVCAACVDAIEHRTIVILDHNQCGFAGKVTARSTANVFDAKLNGSRNCGALQGLRAILMYDVPSRRLSLLTDVFVNPILGFNDVYAMFGTKD